MHCQFLAFSPHEQKVAFLLPGLPGLNLVLKIHDDLFYVSEQRTLGIPFFWLYFHLVEFCDFRQ